MNTRNFLNLFISAWTLVNHLAQLSQCLTEVHVVRTTTTDTPVPPSQPISLTCTISSEPAVGVYYVWRTSLQERTRTPSPAWNETAQTVVVMIPKDATPIVRVFCHVLASSDDSYLGVGQIDIRVQGILSSSPLSSVQPDRIKLVVVPAWMDQSLLQTLSPRVQWYHATTGDALAGGARIQTVSLENGTQTLTILNPHTNDDSGVYEARVSSLETDVNSCQQIEASCDEIAIPLLTHNAITRPVAYEATVSDEGRSSLRPVPSITADEVPFPTHYFARNSPLSFRVSVPLVKVVALNYASTEPLLLLYFNGERLRAPPANQNSSLIRTPEGLQSSFAITSQFEATVTMFLPSVQAEFDQGMYELVFLIPTDQVSLRCCAAYSRLFNGSQGIDLQYVVVGLASFTIIEQATRPDLDDHTPSPTRNTTKTTTTTEVAPAESKPLSMASLIAIIVVGTAVGVVACFFFECLFIKFVRKLKKKMKTRLALNRARTHSNVRTIAYHESKSPKRGHALHCIPNQQRASSHEASVHGTEASLQDRRLLYHESHRPHEAEGPSWSMSPASMSVNPVHNSRGLAAYNGVSADEAGTVSCGEMVYRPPPGYDFPSTPGYDYSPPPGYDYPSTPQGESDATEESDI